MQKHMVKTTNTYTAVAPPGDPLPSRQANSFDKIVFTAIGTSCRVSRCASKVGCGASKVLVSLQLCTNITCFGLSE